MVGWHREEIGIFRVRVYNRDRPDYTATRLRMLSASVGGVSGEVAEWSNALDSKSSVRFQRTVGSNPTLSAKKRLGAVAGAKAWLPEPSAGTVAQDNALLSFLYSIGSPASRTALR